MKRKQCNHGDSLIWTDHVDGTRRQDDFLIELEIILPIRGIPFVQILLVEHLGLNTVLRRNHHPFLNRNHYAISSRSGVTIFREAFQEVTVVLGDHAETEEHTG